ncbi:hypothetical protein [Xanthomonas vesicatoria]|uniref:hypothetical protein n=1 Tax=Xanthomonas vesicatoria TaxID=56460 RepID=UPI0002FF4834|nr:hypothetical protein [Xanthomonas vesicatoria]KTF32917.1 hypothetical protein LMG920_11490 [Xanthomonas vesicatoria]
MFSTTTLVPLPCPTLPTMLPVVDCACALPMATTNANAKARFWILRFMRSPQDGNCRQCG